MVYWLVAIVLIVFGILGSLSIGLPFLLVGLTLLALAPLRGRARAFWPPLTAMVAGNLAFWLITPFYCTASSEVSVDTTGASTIVSNSATCASLLGVPWPANAGGLADPGAAFAMASLAGLIAAALAFALVLAWLTIRPATTRDEHPPSSPGLGSD